MVFTRLEKLSPAVAKVGKRCRVPGGKWQIADVATIAKRIPQINTTAPVPNLSNGYKPNRLSAARAMKDK
jgi:hypothetical protein